MGARESQDNVGLKKHLTSCVQVDERTRAGLPLSSERHRRHKKRRFAEGVTSVETSTTTLLYDKQDRWETTRQFLLEDLAPGRRIV